MSKKTRKFKTEVQQLLDLVIHSLYSKKEIFLRELISNASDAIDRARFEALTNPDILQEGEDWKIRIAVDKQARTITISDNGIGMNAEEVDRNIGTIANSGTKAYLSSLPESQGAMNPEFIGQFGVGFYSAFMVADRVTLVTRRAGAGQEPVEWVSAGDGEYTLEAGSRAGRGTDVTLHLREGMDEFLDDWKIRQTVKAYSDYIAYPIVMETAHKDDKGEDVREDEALNARKAIWKKGKGEVSDEEYHEFYRHISHDFSEPLKVIHFFAEGSTEFRALLYIPREASMDLFMPGRHRGVHLYVKNVFITDDCKELLPAHLRFVKGVVDSSDLPLNVSREMLQDEAIIRRIRKSLVGRVLKELRELQEKQAADYAAFFRQFGRVLKEGFVQDHEQDEKLKDLLLFASSKTEGDQLLSLRDYVARMPSDQKEVYTLAAESLEAARHSPLLEAFRGRGYEVLFLVDPVDEWVAPSLTAVDGKPVRAIDRGTLDLGSEEERKAAETRRAETAAAHKDLLAWLAERMKDEVREVRFSGRLTESACCLVADESGMNANMERILRAMNQPIPPVKRILELNPAHPVVARLQALFEKDKSAPRLADFADLLYGQALLAEGSPVKDPARFTRLVSDLMVAAD